MIDDVIDPTPVMESKVEKTDKQRYEDPSDKKQIKRFLDPTKLVECERHEYQGPQGSGFIDFEYKDGMMRSKHTGPEARQDTNWEWVKVEKLDV